MRWSDNFGRTFDGGRVVIPVRKNKRLQCNATLLFSQYLIFSVDENIESASGCSIDSSVHFAKRMGSELGIDFFTRLEVLVIEGNETRLLSYFDAVAQKVPFINPQITQLSELRSMLI